MRATLLVSAFALAGVSAAQTVVVSTAEEAVKEAYTNFRNADSYVFEMRGTETTGRTAVPVHAILYYALSKDPRTGTKSRAMVELDVFEKTATSERRTLRIVGDGTNLYRYDLDRGLVSTTLYGFYGNVAPQGYSGSDAPKLLAQLRAATPGLATYLVRLLAEMNPAGRDSALRFTTWSPGAKPQAFDEVPLGRRQLNGELSSDDTVRDPLTNRLFVRGGDRFLFYGMDQAVPARTVAFRLYDADGDPNNGVETWEVMTLNLALNSPGRLVDLTITPQTGTIPAGAFVPYTGAAGAYFRPVSGR